MPSKPTFELCRRSSGSLSFENDYSVVTPQALECIKVISFKKDAFLILTMNYFGIGKIATFGALIAQKILGAASNAVSEFIHT